MSKYILGGGIAGLIWAYYNNAFVISPEFGGQMASHFPLGPRYLHNNEYSRKFLADIGLPIEEIEIKIGFENSSLNYTNQLPSKSFREKYFMKSRGVKTLEGYDDTALSSGMNSFKALKVDFTEVINKLVASLSDFLIADKVISVDVKVSDETVQDTLGDLAVMAINGMVWLDSASVIKPEPLDIEKIEERMREECKTPQIILPQKEVQGSVWYQGDRYVGIALDNEFLKNYEDHKDMTLTFFDKKSKLSYQIRIGECFDNPNGMPDAYVGSHRDGIFLDLSFWKMVQHGTQN